MNIESCVPVGREHQRVDDVVVLQGVEMLVVGEVPEHGLAVLAAAGAQGAVGAEGDGVKVPGVAHVVGLQLAVGQVPNLDVLIPSGGHNDGVGVVGREPKEEVCKRFLTSTWFFKCMDKDI